MLVRITTCIKTVLGKTYREPKEYPAWPGSSGAFIPCSRARQKKGTHYQFELKLLSSTIRHE
jgi:hypothetical protein